MPTPGDTKNFDFIFLKNNYFSSNWIAHFLPERYSGLIQLGLLFLGIIFMDGGIAVAFTPFEALLDDMYEGCGVQRAFGIKTLMVSLGGSLGKSDFKKLNRSELPYWQG